VPSVSPIVVPIATSDHGMCLRVASEEGTKRGTGVAIDWGEDWRLSRELSVTHFILLLFATFIAEGSHDCDIAGERTLVSSMIQS
jgi:hypothetical protein